MGNKDIEFVVQRRYFLERFFIQLSQIEYLTNSEEMKIFARPEIFGDNVDIDKQLIKVPKLNQDDMLNTYKKALNLDTEQIEVQRNKVSENVEKLEQTQYFLRNLLSQYTLLKK